MVLDRGTMSLKHRGELLTPTDTVNLTVQFYDFFGNPANTIGFPSISIVQPSGVVMLNTTTAGVFQLNVGLYAYTFTVPFNGPFGVFSDVWQGNVNGNILSETLQFIVENSELPKIINSDGYRSFAALGDDPGFNYSQTAIHNINKILKALKSRLNNNGKAKSTDAYGNVQYIDCSVFSNDMLITFIACAITSLNEIPFYTFYTFEDTLFIDQFMNILVEGATLSALASQALIERGREFQITDNGVNFNPPTVSELLETQYSTLFAQHWEKLKYIKNSMRPSPKGLGTFSMTNSGINTILKGLSHRRARQLF
jgi:hypothetical protein